MSVLLQLQEFINTAERFGRLWIGDEKMRVYVRKAFHVVEPGKMTTTLDIATVEVARKYRKKGLFKEFLKAAHAMNPWDATYVESVQYKFLAASLLKQGFQLSCNSPDSYFLLKEQNGPDVLR